MKLNLILAVIISAVLLLTAGCDGSKSKETKTGTVTLNYWQHSSLGRDKIVQELANKFMAENPDIKVNLEFIPEDDYSTKLISSLAANSGPDVFQVQAGMIGKLAKAGSIQPLNENIISNSTVESEFIPSTTDSLKYNGKYYGLPTDVRLS